MTEPTATAAPDPGLFARVIGVLVSPRATFEKVVANPKPFGVLFLVAMLMGLAGGVPQLTESGRQAALDMSVKQQESFRGRPLTPEEYSRVEQFAKFTPIASVVGPFITLPLFSLILTGIYFIGFNVILGGTASFKQVLSVITHAQVIAGLDFALRAPFQIMQGTASIGGPFNLGALVPFLNEGSILARFLGATSVFTIWSLIVTAMGFSVLYRRKTFNIFIALTIVYILIVGGLMLVFSPRTA
jgi:membrane protein, antimicrobial resistance system